MWKKFKFPATHSFNLHYNTSFSCRLYHGSIKEKENTGKTTKTAGSQVITLTDGKEPKPNRIDLKEQKWFTKTQWPTSIGTSTLRLYSSYPPHLQWYLLNIKKVTLHNQSKSLYFFNNINIDHNSKGLPPQNSILLKNYLSNESRFWTNIEQI